MPKKVYALCLMLAVLITAGCVRSMLLPWVKVDSFESLVSLAPASVSAFSFTLQAAEYRIFISHFTSCPAIRHKDPVGFSDRFERVFNCDITITIHEESLKGPIVFQERVTEARGGADWPQYELGRFKLSRRQTLLMVLTPNTSAHDESMCHAAIRVTETLTK